MSIHLESPPKWLGLVPLVVGLVICLAAARVIPIDESKLHVPRPLFSAVGAMFLAAGGFIFSHGNQRAMNACTACVAACLGTIAIWVALLGETERFRTNLPAQALPSSTGRIVFGFGGAVCWLIALTIAVRAVWHRD